MAGNCIFKNLSDCGDYKWSKKTTYKDLVQLKDLDNDISPHFGSLHLSTEETKGISERFLVNNRAGNTEPGPDNALVCPKHRFRLGIHWRPKGICQHPNHVQSRKKVSVRSIPVNLSNYISKKYKFVFPIGGSMCTKCRLQEGESMKTTESVKVFTESSESDENLPLAMLQANPVEKSSESSDENLPLAMLQADPLEKSSESEEDISAVHFKRTKLNEELGKKGYTPVKHAVENLDQVTPRVIQGLKRKYVQFVQSQTKAFVQATCPGQEMLFNETIMKPVFLSLSQEKSLNFEQTPTLQQDELMDELIRAYNDSKDKVGKLQILSLVPEKYSKTSIMLLFVSPNIKLNVPEKCVK